MTQLPDFLKNRRSAAVAQTVASGIVGGMPAHVSILGGRFTLVDATGEQIPVQTVYLDAVLIDAQDTIQRAFFEDYDPNNQTPPVCFSDNGIGASANAQVPQSSSCMTCPQNQWGSAVSKMTGKPVKACRIMKKVAIMVAGYEFPFQLRIPTMSLDNLKSYTKKFQGQNVDVSDVITRISFVPGVVGELDFNAVSYIDQPTFELREKFLEDERTDELVGRGDVVYQGPPRVAAPAQRPQIAPPVNPAAQGQAPAWDNAQGFVPQAPQQPTQLAFAPFSPNTAGPVSTGSAPATADGGKRKGRPPKPKESEAQQTNVAPFRPQATAAPNAAPFGIVGTGAPPPTELAQQLDEIFKLPT